MSAAHITLVDLFHARSAQQGVDVAFTFLVDGEHEGPRCTFAELDARARAVASVLRERGVRPGIARCCSSLPDSISFRRSSAASRCDRGRRILQPSKRRVRCLDC
jgi:acyl-CoA synthetase (AMP-forming)/AMP-acid ligase II